MPKIFYKNRGQAIAEYILMITVVITMLTAMAVFLRRALQGRFKDARDYMITAVNATYTQTRQGATPMNIAYEYEPYYLETRSEVSRESDNQLNIKKGGRGGIIRKVLNETTTANTESIQAPPKDAR